MMIPDLNVSDATPAQIEPEPDSADTATERTGNKSGWVICFGGSMAFRASVPNAGRAIDFC